jgi:hypothetical protein
MIQESDITILKMAGLAVNMLRPTTVETFFSTQKSIKYKKNNL